MEMAEHQSFKKSVLLYIDILSKNPGVLKEPSDIELEQLKMLHDDRNYMEYAKDTGHYDYYVGNYNREMDRRKSNVTQAYKEEMQSNADLALVPKNRQGPK